jgi:hypothetical protein
MFSSSLLSLVLAASALALPSKLERSTSNLARATPTYPSNWAGAVLANYPNVSRLVDHTYAAEG